MIKAGLIDEIARRTGLKKVHIEKVINTGLEVITEELADGRQVLFYGFGKFDVKNVNERTVCKWDGEIIRVPGKKVPVFKAGETLRKVVDK